MTEILNKLISRLPKDNLTIIQGNTLTLRNGDVYYPFRQDSDFLYLTGLNVPGLVLTIFLTPNPSPKREGNYGNSPSLKEKGLGDEEEVILWREPITEHDITWGSDKLTDDEMRKISGIENIRDITELEGYISRKSCLLSSGGTKDLPGLSLRGADSSLHSEGQELENTRPWQSIIHEMRTIKNPDEIAKIQNCIRITESIYEEILEKVQPGMYEYEIEALIAYGFRRHHGIEAFPTIVASGVNSCTLHYTQNTRKIESGDIILIDFGIELDGYGADISRTFACRPAESDNQGNCSVPPGKRGLGGFCFSERQQEIYDAVEDVKRFAEDTLKPGITRKTWNLGVKEYMYNTCVRLELLNIRDYTPTTNPYYPHSIGHFLGLDTHDVGDSEIPLKAGMVLTIEPGIYISDEAIGIRIEDDYLVTESGCVKL